MPASLLDGRAIAAEIREELRPRVHAFARRAGRPPSLAVVLVGDHPASAIYVRNKRRAATELGIETDLITLGAPAVLSQVLETVDTLNRNPRVDGILVQSPLGLQVDRPLADEREVFDAIDPAKDVDGLHSTNLGRLVRNRAALVACTPSAVMELLRRSGIRTAGARAVVIGRSDIVGKPMALLLLHHDATVTVCHSKTPQLADIARTADILVVAVGKPGFVTGAFIRPGATVIDVGVNRVSDRDTAARLLGRDRDRLSAFDQRGVLLLGDVHPVEGPEIAGAITPVPGGVGPLTVAMLMQNTITAAEARFR